MEPHGFSFLISRKHLFEPKIFLRKGLPDARRGAYFPKQVYFKLVLIGGDSISETRAVSFGADGRKKTVEFSSQIIGTN